MENIPVNLDYKIVNEIRGENKYHSSGEVLDKEMIFYGYSLLINNKHYLFKWENNRLIAVYDIEKRQLTKIKSKQ